MSEVREQSNKEGRLWFLGVDAEEYTGELPEARSRLCVCRDSFLMTFVTSGMSLAGSRQSSIAPNAVESREAPPNTTVSVSSQRHPEQLPEVTGTSRGLGMGNFLGFQLGRNREKKLAAPVAKMIFRIREDEKLLPEQREQLWKALYRAYGTRAGGKMQYLDEMINS